MKLKDKFAISGDNGTDASPECYTTVGGDMARYPGLQRRGARYFVRVRVPAPLRAIVGLREITRRLGTADYRTAIERLHLARAEINRQLAAARQRLAQQEAARLPPGTPEAAVAAARAWLAAAEMAALGVPPPEDPEAALNILRADEGSFGSPDAPEDAGIQAMAAAMLARHGYGMPAPSPELWASAAMAARAGAEHARRNQARIGGMAGAGDPAFADVGPASSGVRIRPTTFGELVKRFEANPSRAVTPKTVLADQSTHAVLLEIIDSRTQLASVDRDACRNVQDIVRRLPGNFTKLKPRRTAERAADHATRLGLPTIATKTANKYVAALAALFRFAEREGLIDRNPATGLMLAGEAGGLNRRPFTIDELQTIVDALAELPGRGTAAFWLPLLGMFSGARLGELAQLDVVDVVTRDGVTMMEIRMDVATGRRVKTRNALRAIPTHPSIVQLGFLDHVTAARQRGDVRVFAELKPAASGYVSDVVSKRFSRWLRGLGVSDPAVSFHAFRHNFRDAMREAGVPGETARALGGWARGESAAEGYGSGFRPATLATEMRKVAYPGLDLSSLV